MIGVNFQPGSQMGDQQQQNGSTPRPGGGVQEAIKILSLRLPKVVGAQAAASLPLLTSPGSNGMIDGVINRIMGQLPQQGPAPVLPSQGGGPDFGVLGRAAMNAPSFGGAASTAYQPQSQQPSNAMPFPPSPKTPGFRFYEPPQTPDAKTDGPVFDPPPGMEPVRKPVRSNLGGFDAPQHYDAPLF
jgi:hypothetical protein